MSYIYYPTAPPVRAPRFPWAVFLILSVGFFLTVHWPLTAQRTLDDYNRSQDDIVAEGAGSAVRQVVLVVLCGLAVLSLVSRPSDRHLRIDGLPGWLVIAYAAWASMSPIWAQDLDLTFKRLLAFGILCVVAVAVVRRFSLRQILMWTLFITIMFLLVAIGLELVSGAFRPFVPGYRFSGTQHPNGEGVECGLLFLSAIALAKIEKLQRRQFGAIALVAFMFLILTASRTSLSATLLAVAVFLVIGSSKRTRTVVLPALGIGVCLLVLLVVTGLSQGLEHAALLGRNDDTSESVESFSGRTAIWRDVGPYISDRPFVGYGYGGFWTPARIGTISDEEKWGVPDSHSTYVDCLLALGVVGLVLYLLSLFTALWRAVAFYRRTLDSHYAFLAALLVFCIVDGFLESGLGQATLLTLFALIAVIRLAYVPEEEVRPIDAESRHRHEAFLPA
jgi:exopolysaccharide production protein ExoQ